MEDTDDHHLRDSPYKSVLNMSNSAFRSQHSFASRASGDNDHESLVKAAMQEAAQHPHRHRMTALPSRTKSSVQVVDVKKLTISQKRLVLSRAMETSGQDNERLLNQIRQRQDRCARVRRRCLVQSCMCTTSNQIYTYTVIRRLCSCICITALRAPCYVPRQLYQDGASHSEWLKALLAALAPRVGLERSKVAIQFRDINYEAEVLIGSSGLPSVSNSFRNLALVLANPSELSICYKLKCRPPHISLPWLLACHADCRRAVSFCCVLIAEPWQAHW